MGGIGGNREAVIQIKRVVRDEIGAHGTEYVDVIGLMGWLDLLDGDSKHLSYGTKLQESTHVFLCDYRRLKYQEDGRPEIDITPENSRMTVDGEIYEVMLYDDPMGMHEHLEIYLKHTGGR